MMDSVFDEIRTERERQDGEWGGALHDDQHDALEWAAILAGLSGKVSRYALSMVTWSAAGVPQKFDETFEKFRRELVQAAAVCVAAIEAYDRYDARHSSE